MPSRVIAVLVTGLLTPALLAPAGARAQRAPTLGAPTPQERAPAPARTSSSGGGLETWQEILIFGAGLALLGGIAFAILGDARERVGATRRRAATSGSRQTDELPHQHKQRSKERARAKTKAARRQRRRNR